MWLSNVESGPGGIDELGDGSVAAFVAGDDGQVIGEGVVGYGDGHYHPAF